jgi:hypothetical protein
MRALGWGMLAGSLLVGCIPAPQLRPRDGGDEGTSAGDVLADVPGPNDATVPTDLVRIDDVPADLPMPIDMLSDAGAADVLDDRPDAVDAAHDGSPADAPCADAGVACSGRCVDLSSDLQHCGRCGSACVAESNESVQCLAGTCQRTCSTNFHRCDARCVDSRLPSSCGDRCAPCPTTVNGSAVCAAGLCEIRCDAGFLRMADRCLPPSAPRPLGPLTGTILGGRSPTLTWALPMGADGAEIEICADRACTRSARRFNAVGTSTTPEPPLDRGTWFWRLRSRVAGVVNGPPGPVWSFDVVGSAPRTLTWGSSPDFDGDGRAELVTSAISVSSGGGRLYRFTPTSVATGVPTSTLSTTVVGFAQFGFSMTAVDVNGDGFSDLIASAPNQSMDSGSVYIFTGSISGPANTAATLAPTTPGEVFGWSVSSAGDFNGDGYGDVVIGGPQWASARGRAYIYFGAPEGLPSTPSVILDPSEAPGAQCGFAVAGVGDLNGDGLSDVAVGCPYANTNAGVVHVYRGTRSGTPVRSRIAVTGSILAGFHLAGVGDVDGDGLPDVAIGAPGTMTGGRAYVFRGISGVADPPLLATLLNPITTTPLFGARVSGGHDLDGDGICDVAVSAPGTGDTIGRAHVFSGRSLQGAPLVSYQSAEAPGSAFGFPAELIGDMNGDGISEIALGEYDAELAAMGVTPRHGRGRIHVARGGASPSPTPTWTIRGIDAAPARFGFSVAR